MMSGVCDGHCGVCDCNVVGVHETDERRRCLELGERHGLDVLTVTKLVVESLSNTGSADVDFIAADTRLNAATTDVSVALCVALCDVLTQRMFCYSLFHLSSRKLFSTKTRTVTMDCDGIKHNQVRVKQSVNWVSQLLR